MEALRQRIYMFYNTGIDFPVSGWVGHSHAIEFLYRRVYGGENFLASPAKANLKCFLPRSIKSELGLSPYLRTFLFFLLATSFFFLLSASSFFLSTPSPLPSLLNTSFFPLLFLIIIHSSTSSYFFFFYFLASLLNPIFSEILQRRRSHLF